MVLSKTEYSEALNASCMFQLLPNFWLIPGTLTEIITLRYMTTNSSIKYLVYKIFSLLDLKGISPRDSQG